MGGWIVLLFATIQKYDEVFIHSVEILWNLNNWKKNKSLSSRDITFLCAGDIRWNNAHEVIARSYCDETPPKSMDSTLLYTSALHFAVTVSLPQYPFEYVVYQIINVFRASLKQLIVSVIWPLKYSRPYLVSNHYFFCYMKISNNFATLFRSQLLI